MRIDRVQIRLALIVVVGALVFGAGLWWPTIRRINQLQGRIEEARQELGLSRARGTGLSGLSEEVEQLRRKVTSHHKIIPTETGLAGVLRELSVQIEAAKLTGQGISTLPTVTKKDHTALPVELTFRGDSLSILRFVRQVEHMPRLMQMESLDITPVSGSGKSARKDEVEPDSPQLQATLKLTTYFSPSEEGES